MVTVSGSKMVEWRTPLLKVCHYSALSWNNPVLYEYFVEQLNEIRKTTLSGLVCVNGDNIRKMQPFAMLASSNLYVIISVGCKDYSLLIGPFSDYRNSHVDCEQIPQMDLSHWQNERLF